MINSPDVSAGASPHICRRKGVEFALIHVLYKAGRGDALLTSSRPQAAVWGLTLSLKTAAPVQ